MNNFEQQLTRIGQKLRAARKSDPGLETFGSGTHRYEELTALPEERIVEFENAHGVELPPAYRAFLKRFGVGRTGPSYGFSPFGTEKDELVIEGEVDLSRPAKIYPTQTKDEWRAMVERMYEVPDEEYEAARRDLYTGILPLGSLGCSGLTAIVVAGEHRGRIVYASMDDFQPDFREEANFLDWYEAWLDEVISGGSVKRTLVGWAKRVTGNLPTY